MSKLKGFFNKHPEIFNIRFGVFAGLLILCVVLLATCRNQSDDWDVQDTPEPPDISEPVEEPEDEPEPSLDWEFTGDEVTEDNISEFITVAQYKGVSFERIVIEDEDVEIIIQMHLADSNAPLTLITDRAVQNGDVVVFDYEGSVDGIVFPGGTDFGHELEIGSGMFIPGFEEQLIGHNAGETFEINVTFPDPYHSAELAGQDAVFKINLISIGYREPTDEFVRGLGWGLETVADYYAYVRERLEERARSDEWNQIIFDIVMDSTFHKVPMSEVEQRTSLTMMRYYYEASMYGIDIEEYIFYSTNGMSLIDFLDYEVRPGAVFNVQIDLVVRAIAVKEGITVTRAEIDDEIMNLIYEYGYESIEHFREVYTDVNVIMALISDRVIDIVMEHAIPVDA